ncbi:Protein-associating with the carboxyl-terminal domain of ezrin [Camelus dromedarius]|uniref:Protein-associating with the carboxyl-terminal domain of ezrin n=1 Tax=Camelus dromedarius TaxID=9838 RepID=A0A5N4CQX4_CAMDR|nr:Protein-associating with the carboxyl-terminal domain of ezrin [Camelus dromedarius]KAB1261086.1 Protein-associating with the carboxyl-terminal domain of ezrin [Camelus dromedarius]
MGSENSALKSYALKDPPFTLPSGLAVYPAVLQDGKFASVFVYKRENEDKVNKAAKGHLTHNNVCLSSVFVSEDGHWKLGGMETVCQVPQATPEFLRSIRSVRDPASIPPEESSPEFTTLPESQGHARDAYSFGTLVESLLTILSEQADVLSSFQQTLHSTLLSPTPQCRPALCTLLSHDFFRLLLDRVGCLSEELIASRLVPLLLNQLVFAEPVAVKSFLPYLLGPKKGEFFSKLLVFQKHVHKVECDESRVVPVLLRLFEVHEEHVRMVLLSHLEAYVEHFTQEQLKKVILPQVLLGLRDTSDSIVAITLHSLAVLVSLLGPEVVVGGERTKIFKRTAPSFTKTIDLSPEDSPTHVVCSQRGQTSPVLENPSSSVFPKCLFSGSMPLDSRQHTQRDYYNSLLQTGNQFSQPIKFPINGISDLKITSGDSEKFPSSSKKSEDWPDWSDPEEPENKAASLQVCPTEPCAAAMPPRTNVSVDEEETWDDFEPSGLDTEITLEGGTTATRPVTSGEHKAIPTSLPLTEEAKPLKSSPPQKTGLAQSRDDPHQTRPTKVSSEDRRPKVPSELGLGEEFTIQVKKKPVRDPELDWFADMTPDIKPSTAVLVLPGLRTEAMEAMVPTGEHVSSVLQFSSKFAAAEMTEGESAGWGEEGELNWEDTNW